MPNTYASTPSATNVSLGRGKLYFNRFDANGVAQGYFALGNCDTFTIAPAVEKKQLSNFMTNTTAPYKEANVKTDVQLKAQGFEYAPDLLALNFLGDVIDLTQSAATVTGETLASAAVTKKGKSFLAAKRNLSAVAVKQGATTLTLTTDYTVDLTTGLVSFPSTSTVVDATAVTIDYTAAVIVATDGLKKVRGANNARIEGTVLFIGDPAAGPTMEVKAFRVNLAPDGELGFISEDFGKWSLGGAVQDDSAGAYGGSTASPYFETIVR